MRTKPFGGALAIILSVAGLVAGGADLRLIDAVKKTDLPAAQALLKQRLDVNARAGDGATALHWAAYRNHVELVQLLIRASASVNATNDLGVTPLWVASTARATATMEALLTAGANPNLVPPTGETPLMIASRTGNVDAIKLLIAHGADVNAKEAAKGQTALMWAITDRQPKIVQLLVEAGADLHARTASSKRFVQLCCGDYNGDSRGTKWVDYGGFTALLFAAREGEVESATIPARRRRRCERHRGGWRQCVGDRGLSGQPALAELLIEQGADLNAAGGGYTALHAAVQRADLKLAKSLIAHGANLNARLTQATQSRRSFDDVAFDKMMIGATPFMLAAKEGEAEFMRAFAAAGADLSLGLADSGSPPFVVAAQGEQRARKGGTLTVVPGEKVNREPERRALEAMRVLLELGANVNAADNAGNTAMHVAAVKRFESVIRFLAEHEARLDARNQRGETPLALALDRRLHLPARRSRHWGWF